MLINVEVIPASVLRASVFVAAYEVGFRNSRTGDPPDDYAVRWAIGETLNLCGALGLLSVGSSWRDRSYGLNQVGNATALEALRAACLAPSIGRHNFLPSARVSQNSR